MSDKIEQKNSDSESNSESQEESQESKSSQKRKAYSIEKKLEAVDYAYKRTTFRPLAKVHRRLQRQRAVLLKRLKVPPPVHQFHSTLDKPTAVKLFSLLDKYRPETKQASRASSFAS
uniref:60S ribosomal protein L7a n=1 Tax=Ditylenchus dipsaci TaxID=166011 RepID=A0A915CR05_9BILA